MAVFGSIAALEKQSCTKKFGKVYEFLKNTDIAGTFAQMSKGDKKTVEIEGRDVYAIFQMYDSKLVENAKIEGHRNYIDVQFIYEGSEKIGYCDIKDIAEEPEYNAEKDIFFCKTKKISHVIVSAGEAAILFPEDLHAPCICIDTPALVKKIVFKVKV